MGGLQINTVWRITVRKYRSFIAVSYLITSKITLIMRIQYSFKK
jgi:hypothetical protein